jgi:hypothetical protein
MKIAKVICCDGEISFQHFSPKMSDEFIKKYCWNRAQTVLEIEIVI